LFAILPIKITEIAEISTKNPSTALGFARVFMSPIAGLIYISFIMLLLEPTKGRKKSFAFQGLPRRQ
jgi:hypothetical protein